MRYLSTLSMLVLGPALAVPPSLQAEIKQIDDEALAMIDGQAGLTIDIDMGLSVGEFMYKDAGSIVMQGIRMGGMNRCGDAVAGTADGGSDAWCGTTGVGEVGTAFGKNGENRIVNSVMDPAGRNDSDGRGGGGGTTGLNNARVHVDIAGDGSTIDYYVDTGVPDPINGGNFLVPVYDNVKAWAWGDLVTPTLCGSASAGDPSCYLNLKDGDLLIHGSATNLDIVARSYQAVDFGFEMDLFAIKSSDYAAGDDISDPSGRDLATSTTIMSNLKMEGYFGGFDMLIANDGNGFGATDTDGDGDISDAEQAAGLGYGDANSKITINSFFEITEMEYDFDIAGIRYEKMRMHNLRGDLDMFHFDQSDYANAANSQGFAQSNVILYAVKDNVIDVTAGLDGGLNPFAEAGFVDGVTFNGRLVADMDIEHMSFGDTGTSIGEQYWTDMDIYTKHTFSAH